VFETTESIDVAAVRTMLLGHGEMSRRGIAAVPDDDPRLTYLAEAWADQEVSRRSIERWREVIGQFRSTDGLLDLAVRCTEAEADEDLVPAHLADA
jgi:hypothetical protein